METLQLAQMLADLSDLNAAAVSRQEASTNDIPKLIIQDPRAAHALVNANKTVSSTSTPSPTAADPTPAATTAIEPTSDPSSRAVPADPRPQQHRRISSSSALASSPFDSYLGRQLLTPPNTRSASSHGSLPGTPRDSQGESDVERASSLVALYELRAKLKQYNDSTSLRQAREKITALSARQLQHQQQTVQTARDAASSTTAPQRQDTPTTRQSTQYTFPRS